MFKSLLYGVFKKGVVTKDHPAELSRQEGRINGKPVADRQKCDLCGICATSCPSGALNVKDNLSIDMGRCIFCGACVERCPKKAIAMTKEFELAAKQKAGLEEVY